MYLHRFLCVIMGKGINSERVAIIATQLKNNVDLLDNTNRDIPTRRREGILFSLLKLNHYKLKKNHSIFVCLNGII